MKFVSKNNNYRVMLKPGVPGNPIDGTPGKSGVSVKFEDGQVIINDPEIGEMIKKHPSFGTDFILVEDEALDPYADGRKDSEPQHRTYNIKHGSVEGVEKEKIELSPAIKKAIMEAAKPIAIEMAKELAPKLAVDLLKQMKADSESEVEEEKPVSKPKKTQKTDKKS